RVVTRSQNNIFKRRKNVDYTAKISQPETHPMPVTHKQAQKDSNWRDAMKAEFDALMKNQTWELVPPDHTRNVDSCKWLFRIKTNSDGSIDRYKARLVAKGFTQRLGVDFYKRF
ncbi:putative mitochondrial protein, partial [Nicotiana attenuata]